MLTIVDYNAGNLRSVKRACDKVGLQSQLTQDPDVVVRASKIIFPGVGAAKSAMDTVHRTGLDQALKAAAKKGTPILGICVGAQIMLDRSEEGDVPALGVIPGVTRRFKLADPTLKIPHIGWNQVRVTQPHPLLAGLRDSDEVYFVHSYYLDPSSRDNVYATTDYGGDFCCAIGRDNLFATQFHPEKSGPVGLALLQRFSQWEGTPC
jgi:glutamine amidotransferase